MKLIYPEKFILPKILVVDNSCFRSVGPGVNILLVALKFSGIVRYEYIEYYYINGEVVKNKREANIS